jgi:hypothetical protein
MYCTFVPLFVSFRIFKRDIVCSFFAWCLVSGQVFFFAIHPRLFLSNITVSQQYYCFSAILPVPLFFHFYVSVLNFLLQLIVYCEIHILLLFLSVPEFMKKSFYISESAKKCSLSSVKRRERIRTQFGVVTGVECQWVMNQVQTLRFLILLIMRLKSVTGAVPY